MPRSVFSILTLALSLSAMSCKQRSSQVDSNKEHKAEGSQKEQTSAFKCNTAKQDPGKDPSGLKYGPTCDELVSNFPKAADKESPENKKVMCPLLRIIHRSEDWAKEIKATLKIEKWQDLILPVPFAKLVESAGKFGCDSSACSAVAAKAAAGQLGKEPTDVKPEDPIDIGNLTAAKGLAHDCGFAFALGDKEVNPKVVEETLKLFESFAKEGSLTLADIMKVKFAMCKRDFDLAQQKSLPTLNQINDTKDSLKPGTADEIEVSLIFTYLGGVDNGTVLVSDVRRLFQAEIPANKTKYLLDRALLAHLKSK